MVPATVEEPAASDAASVTIIVGAHRAHFQQTRGLSWRAELVSYARTDRRLDG